MAIPSLLLALAAFPQIGQNPITPPVAPPQNPVTAEKAVLGKILFWDEQLSSDDTVACGTCHIPSAGFTDPRVGVHPGMDTLFGTPDDRFNSPGVIDQGITDEYEWNALFRLRKQVTRRRTPDVFSTMYSPLAFWDGRGESFFEDPVTGQLLIPAHATLENQAARPVLADAEMAHEGRDWTSAAAKIEQSRPLALATDLPPDVASAIALHGDYPGLFDWAFGTPDVTPARIVMAIATYERTLVPDQAPWALWMAGQAGAMTAMQIDGFNQFNGVAGCHQCHPAPFFTDGDFHNTGLRPIAEDGGRMEITLNPADRGKFRTPSLLNAGLRPRYFHTGQEDALITMGGPGPGPGPGPGGMNPGGVAGFYLQGGGPHLDNKDPLLQPLQNVNMMHVMDFVGNALTDPRVAAETYPFDRPTLYSERVPEDTNLYGTATAGAPGVEPLRLVALTPTVAGSQVFRVGLSGGPAGGNVLIGASWHEGSGTVFSGAEIWIGRLLQPLIPVTLHDNGAGTGYATLKAPLPSNPALIGREVHVQAFLPDPLAPTGTCATRAARYLIH